MGRLTGRTAVVARVSTGIGLATTPGMVEEGAVVFRGVGA